MTVAETYELDLDTFRSLLEEHFSILGELGFEENFTWQFADTCYASWERPGARVLLECGTRLDYMSTYVERLDDGKGLGLDSLAYFREDKRYPPHTGWTWSYEELVERVRLEAEFLRLHLQTFLAPDPPYLEYAGTIDWQRQSDPIDDPTERFSRTCRDRLRFLELEAGLKPEISSAGAGVLYRGDPFSIEISLTYSGPGGEAEDAEPVNGEEGDEVEEDFELFPWVNYNVVSTPGGRLPRSYGHDVYEHEVLRHGPDTVRYFEEAFTRIEDVLRRYLRLRGAVSG